MLEVIKLFLLDRIYIKIAYSIACLDQLWSKFILLTGIILKHIWSGGIFWIYNIFGSEGEDSVWQVTVFQNGANFYLMETR